MNVCFGSQKWWNSAMVTTGLWTGCCFRSSLSVVFSSVLVQHSNTLTGKQSRDTNDIIFGSIKYVSCWKEKHLNCGIVFLKLPAVPMRLWSAETLHSTFCSGGCLKRFLFDLTFYDTTGIQPSVCNDSPRLLYIYCCWTSYKGLHSQRRLRILHRSQLANDKSGEWVKSNLC